MIGEKMDKPSLKELYNRQTNEQAKFVIKSYEIAIEKYGGDPEVVLWRIHGN